MSSIIITQILPVQHTVVVSPNVTPLSLEITEQVTQPTVVVSPQNITNYYGGGGEVLAALTGVAPASTNLGTFTGDIIVDNETIKGALQDLEDGVENNESAISTNAGDIATNANDITSLTTTVNGNTSSINTNTGGITSLQTTVSGLTTGALTQALDPTELNLFFTDPGTYASGTTIETVLRDVLIHYQTPSISNFTANGIPTTAQEHGSTDTITTATWLINNASNVDGAVTGTISYYDPVGTDSQSYTGIAYTDSGYTLNKAITLNVTSGTAGATSTSLEQNNTYYLRLSGLQNTQGALLATANDYITVRYRSFVITSSTAIAAGAVTSTTGNALLADALAGSHGATVEFNNLSSNSRRQTTLTYPDTSNYWYLCMPQCHYEYVNKITTNQGFVGFDITTTVVDCGAFVYTNPEGADVNMQLLRGPSIGQIQSGNYIKTEYDPGSALNTPAPPTAGSPPPATNLFLDDYSGAVAAYSVRKLDKDYTGNCMRIRRDSDDSETDIGFDSSGDLDTAAIASHCGSANGYVVTWYDQANVGGTANNATQSTAADQPQIYNGTAVITENGKPILQGDTSALNISYSLNTGSRTIVAVRDLTAQNKHVFIGTNGGIPDFFLADQSGSTDTAINSNVTVTSIHKNGASYTLPSNRGQLHTDLNSQSLLYIIASFSFSQTNTCLAYRNAISPGYGMHSMQELIIYPDGTTPSRTGIESNINGYYSIYT